MNDKEILQMFMDGMYYTEIADALGIHVLEVLSAVERAHHFMIFGGKNV